MLAICVTIAGKMPVLSSYGLNTHGSTDQVYTRRCSVGFLFSVRVEGLTSAIV